MAQIVAVLLLFLSAVSLIRTKPLHETESHFQARVVAREKRAIEKAVDVGAEEELHRTVKKAGKQIWELKDLSPTELQLLASSMKLKPKDTPKNSKSNEKSISDDEIELSDIARQQNSNKASAVVEKAASPKSHKSEPAEEQASNFESELREMESLWQKNKAKQEVRDLEQISRMHKTPHTSSASIMSNEEKHRMLKRMKSDAIKAYPNYANFNYFKSVTKSNPQHQGIDNHVADTSKDEVPNAKIYSNSKSEMPLMSREKKHAGPIKEHENLLHKAIRMRRSLVHLSSENSMSETSARAMRRRKRDNSEALQEEMEQEEELDPQSLIVFRNLLDKIDDKYYNMKGADLSDSAQDIDEGTNGVQFSKRSSSGREEEFASEKDEVPELDESDESDEEEEDKSEQTPKDLPQNLLERSQPSLLMSMVEYKGTRGLFIPLDQETAHSRVASLMAKEALDNEVEEKARVFALAKLLTRGRNNTNKVALKQLSKRDASFDYPLNVMERSSPPALQNFENEDDEKPRYSSQDLSEYLFSSSDA